MARAADMNITGTRPHDRAAAARRPILVLAAFAVLVLAGVARAQTPGQTPGNIPAAPAQPSQNFANGNPSAAQKAVQDAIPLTPEMIEELGRRFTVKGWNTFANSYIAQGNFDELKRARLLCHAQSQRAAVIHQTSYVQGELAYQVQVPITQTCENVNQTSTNNLTITALVVRTNSDDHPDGLAIDQLVAAPR